MSKSYKSFRKKYPKFIYSGYSCNVINKDLHINFEFNTPPDISFLPKIVVKNAGPNVKRLDKKTIDNFVFNLGLAEIPSYWKATASPKIEIKSGYLIQGQIDWWHDLFTKGMGQYFYENKIKEFKKPDFIRIVSTGRPSKASIGKVRGDRVLVPIGGGKDSTVTMDLLSKSNYDLGLFFLNPSKASRQIGKLSRASEKIVVQRTIDSKLIELNSKGFLNGHTPFSSVLAFISTLCSYLFGYKHVAFSNEASSNEENVTYMGKQINHQYSKTNEFEKSFREYISRYLSNVDHFSFLRPLGDLQIAKLFSSMLRYHKVFLSCNVGQKENKWCGKCPKCLSTFIVLFAFLGPKKTTVIFERNLYHDKSLLPLLIKLIDRKQVKPFECVGTYDELMLGLNLSKTYYTKNDLPVLLKSRIPVADESLLDNWNKENNLNPDFEKILKDAYFK